WGVPQLWRVHRATVSRDGKVLFDGTAHPLGVGTYSKSFHGQVDFDELSRHMVTKPDLPEAYVYHWQWGHRPWARDWALSIPHAVFRTFGPGRYDVDLETSDSPGEMLVGEYEISGRSDRTLVFNAHTCHPRQANDDFAGAAVLIRLF